MDYRASRVGGFLAALLVLGSAEARAQVGSTPTAFPTAPGAPSGPGALANPYANPYLNPYLNPYMTQQATPSGKNTLLYFIAAQQQQGLLAPKAAKAKAAPAPKAEPGSGNRGRKVAEIPGDLMVPGGSASNYFQRGPAPRPGSSSKRGGSMTHGVYFGNNGRRG